MAELRARYQFDSLQAFLDLHYANLKVLRQDAGLLACVNSDDPAYFGGYVDDNLAAVRVAFSFDDAALAGLARNSFDACFTPDDDKARWKAEVDAWLAASTRPDPTLANPAST